MTSSPALRQGDSNRALNPWQVDVLSQGWLKTRALGQGSVAWENQSMLRFYK
ncbi:MAG: hypothetical protein F6K22_33095 [Okeania sp. SIO2F4]|uniref:hypothetical protein n=1 Tax=Okeania sp. SIO2F4 TaxID=2607790 RepID=UPI00142A8AF0|nr:hypothetical protein [Okeania sp. SIO2F4]NES07210.1 hypothetical protein [Okeania sp. SIO2F4]